LDEHPHIESFGGTRRYYRLREAIRAHYGGVMNPGGGWVSRLCFEPRVGLQVLEAFLRPLPALVILPGRPVEARLEGSLIRSVHILGPGGELQEIAARFFLDASDLGDLLPLTQSPYTTGAEGRPDEVQSFTYSFAVDWSPARDNLLPPPPDYAHLRDSQPYSLTLTGHDGQPKDYPMFRGDLPFWTYRRIAQGPDMALINWAGNDYRGQNIIDKSPGEVAAALQAAKNLSLGFLHWLQTEAPRDPEDGGGRGYPELRLRPEVMGTADGLSQAPYIRESRRIQALYTLRAEDLTGPTFFSDSVGVAWYAIDLHACVGNPDSACYLPTQPFQIPLRALLSESRPNLLPACKNIGADHWAAGAYRVHPGEWAIGEAAGLLAAWSLEQGIWPLEISTQPDKLRDLQTFLLAQGLPLAWTLQTPLGHPEFITAQMAALQKGSA
jgi:hypothetical protein